MLNTITAEIRGEWAAVHRLSSNNLRYKTNTHKAVHLVPLLFLLYINDLPNILSELTFRIFADDTNIFASGKNLNFLNQSMNSELRKVKEWCDINKLSIN